MSGVEAVDSGDKALAKGSSYRQAAVAASKRSRRRSGRGASAAVAASKRSRRLRSRDGVEAVHLVGVEREGLEVQRGAGARLNVVQHNGGEAQRPQAAGLI